MRIIPFPSRAQAEPEQGWLVELEAALEGTGIGPQADAWRELREDVRALPPPIAPQFQRELETRIMQRRATPVPKPAGPRSSWLARRNLLGAGAIVALVTVAAVFLITSHRRAAPVRGVFAHSSAAVSRAGKFGGAGASVASSPSATGTGGSASFGVPANTPSGGGVGVPARIQQLAASMTLTSTLAGLQETADRVSRLAVSDGGFVQSSHVTVGQHTGEADIDLSLPSAKLSATLAALGRLAPVSAENQSLQDITDVYERARRRLADANAEHKALLHALSAAVTQGQIVSLRERLTQAREAIARGESSLAALSRRANTAEVEVTVLSHAHSTEGSALDRGLHGAGRVLTVALIVLLIAAAILVPLAIAAVALTIGRRAWRRYQRERALDGT